MLAAEYTVTKGVSALRSGLVERVGWLSPWPGLLLLAWLVSGCATAPVERSPRGPARPLPEPGRERVTRVPGAPTGTAVLHTARRLVGTRYRYGGESRREGFDCSGLAQYVYARHGLRLPRTTRDQANAGWWVPLDELRPGDLVFFSDPEKSTHHVGIVASSGTAGLTMVHASTSQGVVETDVLASGYWLARLRFGRRVIDR